MLVMFVFPDAEENARGDQTEEGIEDDVGPSGEVLVGPVQDTVTVDEGQGGFDSVTDGTSGAQSDDDLTSGDAKRPGGQQEGQQRDGRRQQGSEGDGEDAVSFDPAFDKGLVAPAHIAFEHGLAAFLAGFPGEIAADDAAEDAGESEKPGHFAVSAKDEDEDVGAAWDGQGDGRGVHQGHTEDPEDAKVEEPWRDETVGLAFGREDHGWLDGGNRVYGLQFTG